MTKIFKTLSENTEIIWSDWWGVGCQMQQNFPFFPSKVSNSQIPALHLMPQVGRCHLGRDSPALGQQLFLKLRKANSHSSVATTSVSMETDNSSAEARQLKL